MPDQRSILHGVGIRSTIEISGFHMNGESMGLKQPQPFVKWVGGKRGIIDILVSRMPSEYGDYYEPFVGGGALFWATQWGGGTDLT